MSGQTAAADKLELKLRDLRKREGQKSEASRELENYGADAKVGDLKLIVLNACADYYRAEDDMTIAANALQSGATTPKTENLALDLLEAKLAKRQLHHEIDHGRAAIPGYDDHHTEWEKRIYGYKSAVEQGMSHFEPTAHISPRRSTEVVATKLAMIRDTAIRSNVQQPQEKGSQQ